LIGGYAVGYHGYPRATVDMDVWIAINPANAQNIVTVLKEFGFQYLKINKEASGRPKDLNDLEHLP
jgi:hypothetical protein